ERDLSRQRQSRAAREGRAGRRVLAQAIRSRRGRVARARAGRQALTWKLGEELKKLDRPQTLMMGVVSGYLLTACFGVLTWIAVGTHALPWHWMFAVLL